jgi:RNA polymerase sigma factor (sigma-70 family)
MSRALRESFPRFLRHIAVSRRGDLRSDTELLAAFSHRRDGDAFAALVSRHGPFVWGVCSRLLLDPHDAEDAFQATFLVLARKAAELLGREAISGWLYVVARQTVQNMRKAGRRRQHRERQAFTMRAISDTAAPNPELWGVVDDALAELPDKYRTPLVLCYLQGRTHAEAARELGCAVGSVSWKLARGCELLRNRLALRGVALATASAVAILSRSSASAAMPVHLIRITTEAALDFTAGAGAGAATTSARVAQGVIQSMSGTKLKLCGLMLVVLAGVGLGAGFGLPEPANAAGDAAAPAASPPPPVLRAHEKVLTDRLGDPLPEGALARIGSARLRQAADHIAFLPDGKSFVAGSGSGRLPPARGQSIRVWDSASGKELRRLEGYPDGVEFLGFSPKSQLVAFRGGEPIDVVRLWDAAAGKELPLVNPVRWTGTVECYDDGKLVVLSAKAGSFRLLDVETGMTRVEGELDNRSAVVNTFARAPGGKYLALACTEQSVARRREYVVRLWDVAAGRAVRSMDAPGGVRRLAWSPDGSTLIGLCDGHKALLWDAQSGRERERMEADTYGPLAFSPDGKRMVYVADFGGSLAIRDLATGKEMKPPAGSGWVMARSGVAFTPDGKSLFAGSGSAIRCWDAATGEEKFGTADIREMVSHSALSRDGRLLATADRVGGVHLWDGTTGRPIRTLIEPPKAASLPRVQTSVAFTGDSHYLVAIDAHLQTHERTVWVWDLAGKEPTRHFAVDRGGPWQPVLSPDGKLLAVGVATGGKGGGICQVIELATGKELARIDTAYITVRAAFTPDGRGLATAGLALELWDRVATIPVRVRSDPLSHGRYYAAIAYSPDGKVLATADGSEGLWLWETATGGLLRQGTRLDKPHKSRISYDVAFSPDSRTLATAESDGRVHLWERASGQEVCQLIGHQDGAVMEVAFSGDGRRLVSRGDDGTALVWDLADHVLARQKRHETPPAAELEGWVEDLAAPEASRAYRALRELTSVPDEAVRLLAGELRPVPLPDAGRVKKLLHDLDDDEFAVRQRAAHDLAELGEAVAGDLRATLAGSPSAEVRRQVEDLLRKCESDADGPTPERVRKVALLEYVGTPDSRKLLEALAAGAPEARLTQEARAALGRLGTARPAPGGR